MLNVVNYSYAISMCVIIGVITFALRASSFVIFGKRKMPNWLNYLGNTLPYIIMPTLLLYCIKDVSFTVAESAIPALCGIASTAFIHILKRNTILSLFVGTAVYMILINIM